ncbi:MAG: flippase-like domain-containing protein [Intrasporangium sp.]|uniref:lysylphosphatidylglycerol synthase domain-containing protein n=1 Tax=Intrasporangium sp. TaxID=1925024 RepID=UPI002647A959|nr:lysylphosphatidylglycerol synthase domain-containing protein [Intrasporangium sp.]MDN5796663.1 flippase-like domain-containing protein [Intrasporangium sp.]
MTRRRVLAGARIAIAVLTVAAVGYAVVTNWAAVSVHLGQISAGTFVLSTLAALVGTWLTMLGWRVLLADLGSPLHLAPASGVYFVGQLGKYLPGSLWSVLVQAEIASNLEVPRRRTAVAGLLALGLALLTGIVVGLPAAPLLLRSEADGVGWWVLLALPVVAVLLVPKVLNRLIGALLHLLRRDPLEHALSGRAVVRAAGLLVLAWLTFGVHILLLARAVAGPEPHPHLGVASVAGYALSVSLGMLTVVLPAGLGAREGLLTLILATAVPVAAAGAVAIVSRFIVTVVDVACALLGWLYARRHDLIANRRNEERLPRT